MRIDLLLSVLPVMGYGMLGIFIVTGIIIVIVFKFLDRLPVGFAEINDICYGLYQENDQCRDTYDPEEDPVIGLV